MNKYQSYKPSGVEWIGEIPSEWKMKKIKQFSKVFNGSTPKENPEFWDGDIVWITPSDIGKIKEQVYIEDSSRKITLSGLKSCGCNINPPLSVLMTCRGPIGNVILPTKEFTTNQGCKTLVPENFSYKLLFYHLRCFSNILDSLGQGTTFKELSTTSLKEFKLPIPSELEQHQIVQFLDEKTGLIDKLISTKELKITLLKEQRTSLINEVVTKGLNPYVKMKNTGIEWIGEIPEHWNMVSIKNLVSTKITDGPHETPEWVEEGIPFLSVESVQDNKLDFNKKRGYITEELHKIYSKKCKPQRDDIFIVKSGSTTGKSTIVETDEEFNIWSPLCIVRSNKDKILPRFLFNSIQSFYFRRFIELGWSFGTQPNIGMGVIENLKVVLPPLKEQQPIIDFLNHKIIDIDNLVDLEQKKIDLLKEYRQSLISEVITGKIKVTQ